MNLATSLAWLETKSLHLSLHVTLEKPTCNTWEPDPAQAISLFADKLCLAFRVLMVDEQATSTIESASAMRSLQSHMQFFTKVYCYQSCVLPILLYGSETWTLLTRNSQPLPETVTGHLWFDFESDADVSVQTSSHT